MKLNIVGLRAGSPYRWTTLALAPSPKISAVCIMYV